MLKKIFLLFSIITAVSAYSQFGINIQIPNAGLIQRERLWDISLVNNSEMQEVMLSLNLQDASSGETVLTAETGSVFATKGIKLLKAKDLTPISYSYSSSSFSRTFLPMGSYIACYQVVSITNRKNSVLAEECIRINIDPLSPPILALPDNKSYCETAYPQFSWLPPTPIEMFTDLTFDLIVVEINEGQTPSQAIQENAPIYLNSSIKKTFENYPASFSKLDTSKIYAWQVIARNNLNYAGKTEVWTFKIKTPSWLKLLIEQTPFIKMKTGIPERGIAPNGILKISYMNETVDTSISISVREVGIDKIKSISFEKKIIRGENLIQQDISKLIPIKDAQLYEATILNSKNEAWKLLFEVKEYKDKKTEKN